MNGKKWIKAWIIIIIIILPIIGGFNYVIDPYGLYNTQYLSIDKIKQSKNIRLTKAIQTKYIKPVSIILGNSRADGGYNPEHKYFLKPSYNLATGGGTMYENKKYLELAIKQKSLKQVLFVVNYRMSNDFSQKSVNDFETYFQNENRYNYLSSISMFLSSLKTIFGIGKVDCLYYNNGQRHHDWGQIHCDLNGGHEKSFISTRNYYKNYLTNYIYQDTKNNTFNYFDEIIKLCYENNIKLDIIFGPSHIKQWESLDYYLGYDKWLQWKKDIVLSVNKIANQQNKKQFRIMDFSVYHKLTAERIPADKNTKMKYHWESSHYKNELGLIVLDRLVGDSEYKDFGVELNLQNINQHLKQQEINRHNFIDVDKYQIEAFGKLKSIKKDN